MMIRKALILITAFLAMACGGSSGKRTATKPALDRPTITIEAELTGTYEGTFPQADGPGIETTLNLLDNGTFTMRMYYIGRDTYRTQGTYRIDDGLLMLQPADGDAAEYYMVGERTLTRLDADKQAIKGALAPYYKLHKK